MGQGKSGFVAIVGRPNAGKSTLMNTILGSEISIVSPKAQTTRDRIHGILSEKRGQMVFTDTPGLHRAKEGGLNQALISEAVGALEGGQVIWYLLDPKSTVEHETVALELIRPFRNTPVFLIVNKLDLNRTPARRQAVEEFQTRLSTRAQELGIQFKQTFFISAQDSKHIPPLLDATWALLPEGPAYYPDQDQLSDRPLRFFVGEKIRQQLFRQLGEELPYSCAVHIETFNEKSKPLRIEALIYVERDSQQGMVVGKGGSKIKSIGQAAREDIESFLDQKIYLGLKVKVLKNWTREADALKKLGYILPEKR